MPGSKTSGRFPQWAKWMQDADKDIGQKMSLVAFYADVMKDAEDALAAWSDGEAGAERVAKWERRNFESLVAAVAEKTGADPAIIADKDRRTPEIQRALLEESALRELARMEAYFSSNYMQAVKALEGVESAYSAAETHKDDEFTFKESFVLYFLAMNPDILPGGQNDLTDEIKACLIEQFCRFESFIIAYFGDVQKAVNASGDGFMEALQAFIEQEHPIEAQEIIEHLSSVLPSKYVMPNNKFANTITKGIVDIGRVTLEVSPRGTKKLVETACILTYEGDNVKLSGRQPFTNYDREVYNAVSSLYVYGDQSHVVTPAMVFRAMTGRTDTEKPTPQQIAAVTRSLDKMRFIRAQIDCTEELKMRRLNINSQQIVSGKIDTYLLTADAIEVQAGGERVKAYRIIKTPILYEYANALKQVLTVAPVVLDVKKLDSKGAISSSSLPNTAERILIKGYLIRRIEGLKGKNALHNHVIALYDYEKDGETHEGLYSIAGNNAPGKIEAKRIRDDALQMLAYWKATGYIKGYTERKEGRKITGFEIEV